MGWKSKKRRQKEKEHKKEKAARVAIHAEQARVGGINTTTGASVPFLGTTASREGTAPLIGTRNRIAGMAHQRLKYRRI